MFKTGNPGIVEDSKNQGFADHRIRELGYPGIEKLIKLMSFNETFNVFAHKAPILAPINVHVS